MVALAFFTSSLMTITVIIARSDVGTRSGAIDDSAILPDVRQGDKRVILVDGVAVGALNRCLLKVSPVQYACWWHTC